MRSAKELFELALHMHRRLENLSTIEKGCVMGLLNTMLQSEIHQAQLAIAEQQRTYQRLQQNAAITDEFQA